MSITDVERGLVARYVARVFEREVLTLRATRALLYWLNDRSELLSLPLPRQLARAIGNIYSGGYNPAEFERAYRQNRNRVLAELRSAAEETPRPEPLASNVELLVNELGLPEAAWKVVGLIACYTRFEQVEYLCDTMSEAAGPMTRVISLLVGEESRNVDQLLSPSGDLITSGLVKVGEGDEIAGSAGRYAIPNQVNACLDRTFGDFADMRQALLGAQLASGIEISDYEHVAVDRDLISKVLDGAARESAKGINILLYGPPGTGKTELTKVAAESVGVSLYGAGEEVHSEGEADRSARLQDLVFSLRLLSESDRTALLFDEMEDVAWQLIRRGGSKIYLNRLLEKNPVPILWTSNNIHEIDPALLRRMTLAVELRLPPPSQRQRILHRLADRVGVALSGEEIETLANRIEATPAILENALKAAQLSGGGAEAVERAALGVVRAVSGAAARRPPHHGRIRHPPGLRQPRSGRPDRANRQGRKAGIFALFVRPTRHRKIGLCPLPRQSPEPRSVAQTRLRPARAICRRIRKTHCRRLCRSARSGRLSGFRRGRLLAVRPHPGRAVVGDNASQRNAHLDGRAPLAGLLHDQPDGPPRHRIAPPLHLSRAL